MRAPDLMYSKPDYPFPYFKPALSNGSPFSSQLGSAERIDPRENGLSPRHVCTGRPHVQRDQVLAVRPHRLVDAERLLGHLAVRGRGTVEFRPKKGKPLSAVIAVRCRRDREARMVISVCPRRQ